MSLAEALRRYDAQKALWTALDRARIPDWLLSYAYETLRKHGITP